MTADTMVGHSLSFSIIIPTLNRIDSLFGCLNCLSHYFEPDIQFRLGVSIQVIVSDDAQDAQLKALLLKYYPWCIYTSGPSRGPSANRNNGAQSASNDWIVFTDDDCLPQPRWIEAFACAADHCDVMEGRTSAVGLRTRVDEECPINETGGFLWSCNFAIKRDLFLQLGGFNEDFPFPAMEDVEFNVRVNKASLVRKFVYDAIVLHPWRHRKGYKFVKAYSSSVAKFVSIHPEFADRFSLPVQVLNFARTIKHNTRLSLKTGLFAGLLRQISLDFCSSVLSWWSVRHSK